MNDAVLSPQGETIGIGTPDADRWVFRVNPDAVLTHYTFNNTLVSPATSFAQYDVNFAISVGLEYKFTKSKRSKAKANWVSGW